MHDTNDKENTTLTRAEQARINGAKSHGPTSPQGKLRSSLNRLQHGRYSKYLCVLHVEDHDAYDRLIADLIAQYRPKDRVEFRLIIQLASVEWRKERLDALDVAIIDNEYSIQAAALAAAGAAATQEQIAALATHSALAESKTLPFLATRSAQLVAERASIQRALHEKRKLCSPQLPAIQFIDEPTLTDDFPDPEQPGSNPAAAPATSPKEPRS